MIPYITSERKNNSIECAVDFVATVNDSLVCLSAIDIGIKVKKLFSDIVLRKGIISIHDRENYFYKKDLRMYSIYGEGSGFKYKLSKHDNNNTHGIIYDNNLDDYIYDWNGEGLVKSFTKHLRNKHYLPITEDIVQKVFKKAAENNFSSLEDIVQECEIVTNKEDMKHVNIWKVRSISNFKMMLEDVNLDKSNDNFKWNNVENISDYLVTFADSIKNKLDENVNVLFNKNKINKKMYDNVEPYEGQIPVIQGAVESIRRKDNRFVYLAGQPGTGKTIMSIKTNHLHQLDKGKNKYCTIVVAPTITLTQWKSEIEKVIGDNVEIKIVKDTNEFIRFYESNRLKVNKPTYLLIGKETFKLSYKTKHSVNVVKRNIEVEVEKTYWTDIENKTVEVCTCPDCGLPLKNPLRKTTVHFTEKDFDKPKKSNYKCSECDSVLWQATYEKTKKTSVIDYIKRKNIRFDSSIIDEVHESNNFDSILGSATREILQRSKKSILLSGTVSNGYASSVYNILFALIPNTLRKDNVFNKEDFIKTYGTLMAITKNKDNEYHVTSRTQVKESAFQEVEGVNPLVFTRYFANSFIFVNLEDIKSNIPNLNERYIGIEHDEQVIKNETDLAENIKKVSPYSASFYNESVIKHYTNKPYGWSMIPFEFKNGEVEYVKPSETDIEGLLQKDKKLIEVCKEKVEQGEKVWVYNDFVTNGKYTSGESVENRLKKILEQAGLKVFVLKSTTRTIDRKKIIEKQNDNYDVFLSNPKLVGTGVNMQWCNNYVFYSPTYHVNTVRQAKMRGLRANSTVDNNIYYLYYNEGIEQEIMERYKLKLAESEAVQAKFQDVDGVKRTASNLGAKIEKELAV